MSTEKKVAVLVPCFNRKHLVEQCIESLAKQTYHHLLVICVDDGSTDGTTDYLRQVATYDERFFLVQKNNGGIASARNSCLERLLGLGGAQFIVWVDSDDWIADDFIEKLVGLAEWHAVDMVRSLPVHIRDEANLTDESPVQNTPDNFRVLSRENAIEDLCRGGFWPLWGCLYRAELFEGIVFDEKMFMCEDFLVLPSIFQKANAILETDYHGYYYRVGNGHDSITNQRPNNRMLLSICQSEISFAEYLLSMGRRDLFEVRVPIIAQSSLGLYGRFRKRGAPKDELDWLCCISNYLKTAKIIKMSRPANRNHRILRALYLYARPLFYLAYRIKS